MIDAFDFNHAPLSKISLFHPYNLNSDCAVAVLMQNFQEQIHSSPVSSAPHMFLLETATRCRLIQVPQKMKGCS